jgi:hypothetical protein
MGEVSMSGYLPHIINSSFVVLTAPFSGNRTGHKEGRAPNATYLLMILKLA